MSESNLTRPTSLESGFYGKLPSLGDFASRRLQQDFISSWDSWLQRSLAASQEVLGEQWLNSYLVSPIWRFALSPGLCGKDAWLGVVMPSVDRVGRYFPLTIASKVNANTSLIHMFSESSDWFEALETAAISALENDLAVEQFDTMVKNIKPCEAIIKSTRLIHADNPSIDKSTIYIGFEQSDTSMEQMLPEIASQMLSTHIPGHSLWCTTGAEDINSAFVIVNGLPSVTTYVEMITGQLHQSTEMNNQAIIPPVNNLVSESTENNLLDTDHDIKQAENNLLIHADNDIQLQTDNMSVDSIDNNRFDQIDDEFLDPVDNSLLNQAENDLQNQAEHNSSAQSQPQVQTVTANAITSNPEQRVRQSAWQSYGRTDTGKKRKLNEDSILERPDLGIWVVADGMGGHQAGDVASQKIINTLNELNFSDSLDSSIIEVKAALQLVNNELKELAARRYDYQIIGSTVAALIAGQSHFAYLWAGDSRVYRLRDNKLLQLTIDHSSEQEDVTDILNLGISTPELKQNNVITRAVGAFEELELDYQIVEIQSGDVFLLSSDGLDKELSFSQIEQVLINNNALDSVDILLEQVLNLGARDNVSIIVVEIK